MPKKSDYTTKYVIVCALVSFLMPGCASQNSNAGSPVYYQSDSEQRTRSPVTFVSDAVLMARVKSKFMSDDMVNDQGIHVKVRHGVVYLDGCVADIYQRRMAQDLVGSIDGVVQVINRLKVTNPGTVFINTDIR